MGLHGKYRRHGCIETAGADRLADRRREIRGQPEPVHGRMLRTDGRGGPAALAYRRFRPHAASRDLRAQFHLEAGRRGRGRHGGLPNSGFAGFSHQPADHRVPAGAGGSGADRRAREQPLSDHRGTPRRRRDGLYRAAAALHRRHGERIELDHQTAGRVHRRTAVGAAEHREAAGAGHRNHDAEPHRCEPAGYLCRQPRRRTHPRRPDQARPHRDHECRDLAVRPARLHLVVRSRAGGNRGRRPRTIISTARLPRSAIMAAKC